jgi:hypothetical protein
MQARAREGTIDFSAVLDALETESYGGALAIEYQCEEWLECHRVDCVTETAEMRDLVLEWAAGRTSSDSDKDIGAEAPGSQEDEVDGLA